MSTDALADVLESIQLVDHHVHGALAADTDRGTFEEMITESDRPIPAFMTQMDSQIGFAIRNLCAPLLGLDANASAIDYFDRRAELGEDTVNSALLHEAHVGDFLLDTGYRGDDILDLAAMATASAARTHEIVRLETLLEHTIVKVEGTASGVDAFRDALTTATRDAVGLKSIVAYRLGFDFDPVRPSTREVNRALEAWKREIDAGSAPRVTSPILLRFLLWEGVERGLPLQLHVGYGDPDVDLNRCDPLLLTPWIRSVEAFGTPLMLLHCYPFHRNAGYLAQVFPHVYFDVGLAINYIGSRSPAIIEESLELAPFAKMLYSSDAWGPAELHYLGATLWRQGMGTVLGAWVEQGRWSLTDAKRVATMIGRDNARRVYGLTQ